jgi:hypothetical protein
VAVTWERDFAHTQGDLSVAPAVSLEANVSISFRRRSVTRRALLAVCNKRTPIVAQPAHHVG